MTKWLGLETFAGEAVEVTEHLDAIAGEDEDAAWEALDILRDVAVPSRSRRDPPYCSAAPAIVGGLLDVARSLDDDERRGAVLRLTAEILAADHRDLFVGAQDVPAALAILHGSGAGADVAATVGARADEIAAHLSSPHAPTRAGAWFLLGLLPSRPLPAAAVDADEILRNLRSFLAGMWRDPAADGGFAWLGSLSGPHGLPEPATSAAVLGSRLPAERFPFFDGRICDLAAARAKALDEERGSAVAEALLRAWEAGASHLGEAAARACLRARDVVVRPDALSALERRVVERATAEDLRVAAFASTGVPVEPDERAAWLGVGARVVDRPPPRQLEDRREREPLGAWLARMDAAGTSEEAKRALRASLAPEEYLDVLKARLLGAYDLQPPPAEEVLDAIERAGVDGIATARSMLASERLRRTPAGDLELGWGLGAPGNAALLALARVERWTEIPEQYVAFVSFDGPPSWFSELVEKLRQVDRARLAAAGARRMPITRLRRADYESLARILAHGRSAEATAIFADRARAGPRGETLLAELREVSRALGLVVPGL